MLNEESGLLCLVLPVVAAIVGWFASGASHRRRFVRWQMAYQSQVQSILHREAAKAGAEIAKLKDEIVKLKAERLALQSRQRVVDLKRWVASLPRLRESDPAPESSDDGFADTQPFEQRE